MSDENKPDNMDEGDDLLSDFNDLFPEEGDDELDGLEIVDDGDDLESLLDGLDKPDEVSEESSSDEDDIDSLLDDLEESVSTVEEDSAETTETPAEESSEAGEEISETPIEETPEIPEADIDDDLDNLLDGLEDQVEEIIIDENGESEDDLDNLLDEMMDDTETDDERALDINQDDLDLSVDSDELDNIAEDTAEESALDELISTDDDSFSADETELEPPSVIAAAVATTTREREEIEEPVKSSITEESRKMEKEVKEVVKKAPSRSAGIVVYLLLLIALGVAGGSIWMTLQAQQAVDKNSAKINKLQKQQDRGQRAVSGSTYNPLVEQNSGSIRDLDQRINELSKMIDGPLSHMNANISEEVIGKLEERLQQLEQNLTELKEELAKRPTVVAATTSPPLLVKAQKSSPKTVKLWVVNLLSLSSRKGAGDAVKRIQAAGVDATRDRFTAKDGKTWYRVRVTGFSSYEAAKAYAREMPKIKGISKNQTWVTPE